MYGEKQEARRWRRDYVYESVDLCKGEEWAADPEEDERRVTLAMSRIEVS